MRSTRCRNFCRPRRRATKNTVFEWKSGDPTHLATCAVCAERFLQRWKAGEPLLHPVQQEQLADVVRGGFIKMTNLASRPPGPSPGRCETHVLPS